MSLRTRVESDFEAITTGQQDESVLRWLTDRPIDNDSPAAGVRRAVEQWHTGTGTPFVIADAQSDHALGVINLKFASDTVAGVAYSVFAAARGRGVAARAVRLLTDWAFHELNLEKVILEADRRNTASIRVAQKSGFRWTHDSNELCDGRTSSIMAVFEPLPSVA